MKKPKVLVLLLVISDLKLVKFEFCLSTNALPEVFDVMAAKTIWRAFRDCYTPLESTAVRTLNYLAVSKGFPPGSLSRSQVDICQKIANDAKNAGRPLPRPRSSSTFVFILLDSLMSCRKF